MLINRPKFRSIFFISNQTSLFSFHHLYHYIFSLLEFLLKFMDIVKGLVQERPVVIFSKTNCPVSHSMIQLISGFGANPTVYELDQLPNGRDIKKVLQMMGCKPSVPSIFIGGNFVGGPNDVLSLQVQGRLAQMLMDAGAIWLWNGNQLTLFGLNM